MVNKFESEYGGKDGVIAKDEDGHTELTAQEKAMLLRSEGRRGAGMMRDLPADDQHRGAVDAYEKDRVERFNGRTSDDVEQ